MTNNQYIRSRCGECLSSLQGMLKRERTSYACQSSRCTDSEYTAVRRSLIDVYDEIFTLCQLQNRETVAVAVSYMDRFMASSHTQFVHIQLAAMTCFYLAVKLYEPTVIPPAMICEIFQRILDCGDDLLEEDDDDASTGTIVTGEAIESMELQVLSALKWNLNPPTSIMFVRQLLCCLPDQGLEQWKPAALQLAQAQLDIGLKADETMKISASTQAVAALFAAVSKLPTANRSPVYKFLLQAVHMTGSEQQREVLKAQQILKQLAVEAAQTSVDEPECSGLAIKRTLAAADVEQDERPAKKQRVVDSPRSILITTTSAILA